MRKIWDWIELIIVLFLCGIVTVAILTLFGITPNGVK